MAFLGMLLAAYIVYIYIWPPLSRKIISLNECCQKTDNIPHPKPKPSFLPTEVKCDREKTFCEVLMNGRESDGIETIYLYSGETAVVRCVEGCEGDGPSLNKNKVTRPFWGISPGTIEQGDEFRFSRYENRLKANTVPPYAVIAILGGIYNPEAIAFPKWQSKGIIIHNGARKNLPLFLYFNGENGPIKGNLFADYGLNGKRFKIIVQKTPY